MRSIYFGAVEASSVPQGWQILPTHDDFAQIQDPSGHVYFIARDVLYALRYCPPEGIPGSELTPGQRFLDDRVEIPWPEGLVLEEW
jgi:hypothetical protein